MRNAAKRRFWDHTMWGGEGGGSEPRTGIIYTCLWSQDCGSVYIYTFDPKTVDVSRLGAVAGAVVGIDPYSYGFDPKTVDLEVHIFQLVKFVYASGFGGLLWFANLCCGSVASRGVSICDGHSMCAFVSCVLVHLPWFHNCVLTLTDNSGQTDMFLGQQKCRIVPAQLIRQLLSRKMIDDWH